MPENFEFTYSWMPQSQLVHVRFDMPISFKQDLYEAFFVGRSVSINADNGNWVWIECQLQEWQDYLTFSWGALCGQLYLKDQATAMAGEIAEFKAWRKRIEAEPFVKRDMAMQ